MTGLWDDINSMYLAHAPAVENCICPDCGFGEVMKPMQTMDMPMLLYCLRCGKYDQTSAFDTVGDENE
jgi:hypothetical protein